MVLAGQFGRPTTGNLTTSALTTSTLTTCPLPAPARRAGSGRPPRLLLGRCVKRGAVVPCGLRGHVGMPAPRRPHPPRWGARVGLCCSRLAAPTGSTCRRQCWAWPGVLRAPGGGCPSGLRRPPAAVVRAVGPALRSSLLSTLSPLVRGLTMRVQALGLGSCAVRLRLHCCSAWVSGRGVVS